MVRVVVGVHARRGDKLRVWRQQTYIRDILSRYEGRFLRHAMEVRTVDDIPQNFHNNRRRLHLPRAPHCVEIDSI